MTVSIGVCTAQFLYLSPRFLRTLRWGRILAAVGRPQHPWVGEGKGPGPGVRSPEGSSGHAATGESEGDEKSPGLPLRALPEPPGPQVTW